MHAHRVIHSTLPYTHEVRLVHAERATHEMPAHTHTHMIAQDRGLEGRKSDDWLEPGSEGHRARRM